MWEKEIKFVQNYLITHNGDKSPRIQETFRHRTEHVVRVLKWANLIIDSLSFEERKNINKDVIELAAIFHDVGYGSEHFKNSHGIESSQIFKEYALGNGFDEQLINEVYNMIYIHQNKALLNMNISENLRILMEADMLDEEGAMSIVWDLITLGQTFPQSYEEALYKLTDYSAKILKNNPMRHKASIEAWENKQKLVKKFIDSLKKDLFIMS